MLAVLVDRGQMSPVLRPPNASDLTRRRGAVRPGRSVQPLAGVIAAMIATALVTGACAPGSSSLRPAAPPPSTSTSTATATSTSTSVSPRLREALRMWRDFPVTATPRPLLITGETSSGPASGFTSDDAKIAFVNGAIHLETTLPPVPSTAAGYPVLPAAAAFAELRAGQVSPPLPPTTMNLPVTDLSLTAAPFQTDRGERTLPAWRFTLGGVSDPIFVLAITPASLWPRPATISGGLPTGPAALGRDGRTILLRFVGAPTGPSPCDASYAASTAESVAAVAISVHQITPNPLGGTTEAGPRQACPLVGEVRTLIATLQTPLGNRVLVSEQGDPIAVTGT